MRTQPSRLYGYSLVAPNQLKHKSSLNGLTVYITGIIGNPIPWEEHVFLPTQ